MKYAAIFMIVLVAVGLVLGVYTYTNARLVVASVSMNAVQGFEKPEDFAALQNAVDQSALMGTAYTDLAFKRLAAVDYKFFQIRQLPSTIN